MGTLARSRSVGQECPTYDKLPTYESLRTRPVEQRDPKPEQYDDARFDAEVQRRAEQIANTNSTAQRLDSIEADVKKAIGDTYDDFIDDITSIGKKPAAAFMTTVLEMDDSAKILAHLAGDRDELDKVMKMTPVRQAAYMGRLSVQLETDKTPKVSTAPKPLTPLTSRTTSRQSPASASDEDMVRQIRASRA